MTEDGGHLYRLLRTRFSRNRLLVSPINSAPPDDTEAVLVEIEAAMLLVRQAIAELQSRRLAAPLVDSDEELYIDLLRREDSLLARRTIALEGAEGERERGRSSRRR